MDIRQKVKKILNSMTLEEKIGQTNMLGGSIYSEIDLTDLDNLLKSGRIGSVMCIDPVINNRIQERNMRLSRLGIPILFCGDIIHGISTIFPIPLAESCSWRPELAERTAAVMAKEGAALGCRWTFAPMVDVGRDARWGRVMEGCGEDALLTGDFAAAKVRGFQGTDREKIGKDRLAACVKHFWAYGLTEGGKEYAGVTVSERDLENRIGKPYQKGVEAGALTVMSAFHEMDGTPCTVNNLLLDKKLRKQWGFDGVIVSDFDAIGETVKHGYCRDGADAAACAINATVDIDMMSLCYADHIKDLIEKSILSVSQLDAAVERILTLKYRVGVMDDPYTDESRQRTEILQPVALDLALESALHSAVLLKNENALPLKPAARVALLGELADDRRNMLGNWSYYQTVSETVTIREGLLRQGIQVSTPAHNHLEEIAQQDAVVAVVGQINEMAGEACSLTDLNLPPEHRELVKKAAAYGKPVILVVVAGRPLSLTETEKHCSAILYAWHLGTCAGTAIAEILTGKFCPCGKLTMSFPQSAGQCPVYYNHNNTGRPHIAGNKFTSGYFDCECDPRWPFGFGLSYTDIRYGDVSAERIGDVIHVTAMLENCGKFDTREIVQVYCRKRFAKPVRPIRELVGYQSIPIAAGEKKTVTLSIPVTNFFYVNEDNSGEYELFVGKDSTCDCTGFLTLSL